MLPGWPPSFAAHDRAIIVGLRPPRVVAEAASSHLSTSVIDQCDLQADHLHVAAYACRTQGRAPVKELGREEDRLARSDLDSETSTFSQAQASVPVRAERGGDDETGHNPQANSDARVDQHAAARDHVVLEENGDLDALAGNAADARGVECGGEVELYAGVEAVAEPPLEVVA